MSIVLLEVLLVEILNCKFLFFFFYLGVVKLGVCYFLRKLNLLKRRLMGTNWTVHTYLP